MADGLRLTEPEVWVALEEIPDPEIPVISLVDLGVISRRGHGSGQNHGPATQTGPRSL